MWPETALKNRTITASGFEQLRLDIYKNLNIRSSIEFLCEKYPPSAIPETLTVILHITIC
ncbi:hypothetical protein SAMN05421800_1583 [Chryseobacterium balustinum]|uniref:Uncharacterized protein n=1 Tax=Chryseobacterium balustinum TaxID=246 RepID=A0AAX2IIL0_9FLAO|nr:hypothetical protein SAMN05421800_1583 [Chryseobacterium balustinum]SQA88805.1 Uncharacterised protein [Chryseobacterium balustinum]